MQKPNYQDHKTKKPTRLEIELNEKIRLLQQNFELVVINMRAQVRAVCIANGISPELFVESFHNEKAQEEFNSVAVQLETDMMAKAAAEANAKKAAEISQETRDSIDQIKVSEEQLHDLIEGEGDKIE